MVLEQILQPKEEHTLKTKRSLRGSSVWEESLPEHGEKSERNHSVFTVMPWSPYSCCTTEGWVHKGVWGCEIESGRADVCLFLFNVCLCFSWQ